MITSKLICKGQIIIGVTLGIMVLIMCFIAVANMIDDYIFFNNAQTVEGTVSDVKQHRKTSKGGSESTYYVYINYEIDGKVYSNVKVEHTGDINLANCYVGEHIEIRYNPHDKYEIGIGDFHISVFNVILMLFFLIFITVAALIIINGWNKLKKITYLMNNGAVSYAEVIDIVSKRNRQSRYYIVKCQCVHPLTGHTFYCDSSQLGNIRGIFIGSQLNAYFSYDNYGDYFIDLKS